MDEKKKRKLPERSVFKKLKNKLKKKRKKGMITIVFFS